MYEVLVNAAETLRKKIGADFEPEIGLVLGTGLGQLADKLQDKVEVSYGELPDFPVSTVQSHAGKFLAGTLEGKKVLVMQGRFHYYEGYSLQQVVMPIRVMGLLGIRHLVVTNAAGGLAPAMETGEVMLITDHINMLGDSPLCGPNIDQLGPRFPDMHEAYAPKTNALIRVLALEEGIRLHEGVYAAVMGPALETAAEYRYIRTIGADAVGMSTVPEVLAAKHMGIPCTGFSAITDLGVPGKMHAVSLQDVLEAAEQSGQILERLLLKLMKVL